MITVLSYNATQVVHKYTCYCSTFKKHLKCFAQVFSRLHTVVSHPPHKQSLGGVAQHARGEWGVAATPPPYWQHAGAWLHCTRHQATLKALQELKG